MVKKLKVATTVLRNENQVLLIKKPTNRYSMPGGKTEHMELPIKTAAREFYEETGLKLSHIKLKVISSIRSEIKDFELYTFYSEIFEGDLIINSAEGELQWVNISELTNLEMYPSDLEIINYCLSAVELVNKEFTY